MHDNLAASTVSLRAFARAYVAPYAGWYAASSTFLAATGAIAIAVPGLVKQCMDGLAAAPRHLPLVVIALGVLQILVRALSRICIFWPARQVEGDVKVALFHRLLHVPETFFRARTSGDLQARLNGDVNHLRILFAFAALQAMNIAVVVVLAVGRMALTDLRLTVAALTPLAAAWLVTRRAMPRLHAATAAAQKLAGTLAGDVQEVVANVETIQACVAEDAFVARVDRTADALRRANLRVAWYRTVVIPSITLLSGLSYVAVLWYGGARVLAGSLTVGDLTMVSAYVAMLSFPLAATGIVAANLQRGGAALKRLREISEVEPQHGADGLAGARGGSILTVTTPAVQFTVASGEIVALTGPVGSGKSTLLAQIVRLAEPEPATVFLNGTDVATIAPDVLRRTVGYGATTPDAFRGSVTSNLRLGLSQLVDEQAAEALADAAFLDEVLAMPGGLAAAVSARGANLSGGQRQRLALARLLLRTPPLLVLDDPTAAVDEATEARVFEALRRRGATVLVASHRASVLRHCDRVVALGGTAHG